MTFQTPMFNPDLYSASAPPLEFDLEADNSQLLRTNQNLIKTNRRLNNSLHLLSICIILVLIMTLVYVNSKSIETFFTNTDSSSNNPSNNLNNITSSNNFIKINNLNETDEKSAYLIVHTKDGFELRPRCPKGSYGPLGLGPCTLCPLGTFNNELMASNCQECPEGQTTRNVGTTSSIGCNFCSNGYYDTNDYRILPMRCTKCDSNHRCKVYRSPGWNCDC